MTGWYEHRNRLLSTTEGYDSIDHLLRNYQLSEDGFCSSYLIHKFRTNEAILIDLVHHPSCFTVMPRLSFCGQIILKVDSV
jgi:hypothetical protein